MSDPMPETESPLEELARLLREATKEIEKLRAQVVSLQSSLDAGPPKPGKKTPDALGENR